MKSERVLNKDLYSNLIAYIGLIRGIEEQSHRPIFTHGISYWWYNPSYVAFQPTKYPTSPTRFKEYGDWVLIAKTENSVIVADTDTVEESDFQWQKESNKN
jgi:hypothetical protein